MVLVNFWLSEGSISGFISGHFSGRFSSQPFHELLGNDWEIILFRLRGIAPEAFKIIDLAPRSKNQKNQKTKNRNRMGEVKNQKPY